MIEELIEYLEYPFVVNALAAGVLISMCAALIGVPLVLKRLSFAGDGLSHVAFGAMAVAGALNFSDSLPLMLGVTVASSLMIFFTGRGGRSASGDAILAMLSVAAMAAGYLIMNLHPSSSNISGDVCTTLFGSISILTLTDEDMRLCAGLSVAVAGTWCLLYNRLFDTVFDEDFARASGTNTTFVNAFAAVVIAVVIVISMRLVGTLLVSALLVFPAVSAMRVVRSYRAVTLLSALIGTVCTVAGILAAILFETPVGATIVAANAVAFAFFFTVGLVLP
ncbi:MAG: metal ABC transporter permease [Kiritimatiellae bacterium]|nr:metal ABC transporter permease [Kiritimatiellia bacterium]